MAEIWAAAAITVVGGVMASRSAKKQSKFEAQADKESTAQAGYEERVNMAFGAELDNYYTQLERQRRIDSLNNDLVRTGMSSVPVEEGYFDQRVVGNKPITPGFSPIFGQPGANRVQQPTQPASNNLASQLRNREEP